MAERARSLDDGAYDAEVVGTPTPFQVELEKLMEEKRQKLERRVVNSRPTLVPALESDSKAPQSSISPELRAEAEATFAKLKGMSNEDRANFRAEIMSERPELLPALKAVYREGSPHRVAEIKRRLRVVEEGILLNEQALAMTDEAQARATRAGEAKLKSLKKASGE